LKKFTAKFSNCNKSLLMNKNNIMNIKDWFE